MQAGARGERRDAERPGGLGRRQLLPADQHQQLPIRLPQLGQCLQQGASLLRPLDHRQLSAKLVPQPLREAIAPARAAIVIGEDVAGRPVEPEARLAVERHLAEASPGDEERLGDDVGRVLGISGAPQRVPEDVPRMLAVQVVDPRLRDLAWQSLRHSRIGAHRSYMSGSASALRERRDSNPRPPA